MSSPIRLLPLTCVHCQTPLSANEEEIAWMCPQCGQGTQLTPDGTGPLKIVWAASRPGQSNLRWLPFWTFLGQVNFTRRDTYGGHEKPNPLWSSPIRFYIPAFSTSVDTVEALGAALTKMQPAIKPGPAAGRFGDCTLLPEDAWAAAEFVVLTVEAERQDMLRTVEFAIDNRTVPELWLLPFTGEPSSSTVAV
jgi:hypothetical protein